MVGSDSLSNELYKKRWKKLFFRCSIDQWGSMLRAELMPGFMLLPK
jgi:hypothetical protein